MLFNKRLQAVPHIAHGNMKVTQPVIQLSE